MPSQYGTTPGAVPHAHTNAGGDGGALTAASTLLGNSLLSKFLSYRRPVLVYTTTSTLTAENNTSNANETGILFPDNDYRVDSTSSHRVLTVTRAAIFNGANQSGGLVGTPANNTWFAVYAVKCQNNTTDFVLVHTTVLPLQGNWATLNSNFGLNGWIYLGVVPYGTNDSGSGNIILGFVMVGNKVMLQEPCDAGKGRTLANVGSATSLAWTPSFGTSSTQIPGNINNMIITILAGGTAGTLYCRDGSGFFIKQICAVETIVRFQGEILFGMLVETATAAQLILGMSGYHDQTLGIGANPQI